MLVHGLVAAEQGIIDKPLSQFGSGRVGVNPQHGRVAVTEYLVLTASPPTRSSKPIPKPAGGTRSACTSTASATPSSATAATAICPSQRQDPRMMLHAQKLTIRLRNNGS